MKALNGVSIDFDTAVRAAGYKDIPVGVMLPDGYRVVPVGGTFQAGDWFYDIATREWLPHTGAVDTYVGNVIDKSWSVVIRHISMMGAGAKWSCGHGRDEGDQYCIVCHVFMRYIDS